MVGTNIPDITKRFMKMIEAKAREGTYRVNIDGVPIDVFPYVFPPQSPFSESTHSVYDHFGNLKGQVVLDIGTGTGIQAIQAALAGAQHVHAVDIYSPAVSCAKHNVKLNKLEEKVDVWQSDLFNSIREANYDLIIANLPIEDLPAEDLKWHSLFDPQFSYHERLFSAAKNYLCPEGKITLCHADLHEGSDFQRLEGLARKYGFKPIVKKSINSLGHEWRSYEFIVGVKK